MMLLASMVGVVSCSEEENTPGSSKQTWDGTVRSATYSSELGENQVQVTWDDSAQVVISSNLSGLVSAEIRCGAVTLLADNSLADEVTYTLSGTSSRGSLYMDGSYKATFVLNGLTLNSTDSAAINIRDGKRIAMKLADGTTNTLADASGGSHKACMTVKGHTEFSGGGSLTLAGRTGHAFWGKEYVQLKSTVGTIKVTEAVGDGFNVNQYFEMKGGTLDISGVGDDGIQVSYKTDDDDNIIPLTEDEENTGEVLIKGGTLSVAVTAEMSKGIKSEGDITISDGTLTVTTSGKYAYDNDDKEYKSSVALKTDADLTIGGGTLTLKTTGYSGKCIRVDGAMKVSGGTLSASATGASSSTYGSAKAIKATGALTISGGTINASASSHEAIETKSTLSVTGGTIYAAASDDAINSGSTFTVSDGHLFANSSGNDGIDSNGNMTISGGTVVAVGASGAEVGIDVIENGKLTINGGHVIAIGGLENTNNVSGTCYQASSYNKGAWYGFYDNGGTLITAFKVPSNSSMGTPMAIYTSTGTPVLKTGVTVSGTSYWNGNGYSSCSGGSTVSLSTYTSNGMGGGGGPGGGRGGK